MLSKCDNLDEDLKAALYRVGYIKLKSTAVSAGSLTFSLLQELVASRLLIEWCTFMMFSAAYKMTFSLTKDRYLEQIFHKIR